MTTITSLWKQCWAAACPSCPLALRLPWTLLRRPTSTTHPVSGVLSQPINLSGKVRACLCLYQRIHWALTASIDQAVVSVAWGPLFISTLSAPSCHLHLCERVYSGFSGARLRVLLFPAEAEHHLRGLSSRQQGPRPGDLADHHGEGLCNVCERGADPEIRHHQQDQPGWRWVLRKVHITNVSAG